MLSHILRQGDRVQMNMDSESRAQGRKGVPNGTSGVIAGRARATGIIENRYPASIFRESGIYERDTSFFVIWSSYPDGVDPMDPDYASVSATDMIPDASFKDEYELRYKELWPVRNLDGTYNQDFCIIKAGYKLDNMTRTGDLPETAFWELDLVTDTSQNNSPIYQIVRINYNSWGPGKLHCYDMREVDSSAKYNGGGQLTINPTDLKLYERGNVWRELHGEDKIFNSIEEEAEFELGMGRTEDLRNPKTDLYSWTIDEAINALKEKLAHGINMSGGFFGGKSSISVKKFQNIEIGNRVREKTLEGFR